MKPLSHPTTHSHEARFAYVVVTTSFEHAECDFFSPCHITKSVTLYSIKDVNYYLLNLKLRSTSPCLTAQVIVYYNGAYMAVPFETLYLVYVDDTDTPREFKVTWKVVENFSNEHSKEVAQFYKYYFPSNEKFAAAAHPFTLQVNYKVSFKKHVKHEKRLV